MNAWKGGKSFMLVVYCALYVTKSKVLYHIKLFIVNCTLLCHFARAFHTLLLRIVYNYWRFVTLSSHEIIRFNMPQITSTIHYTYKLLWCIVFTRWKKNINKENHHLHTFYHHGIWQNLCADLECVFSNVNRMSMKAVDGNMYLQYYKLCTLHLL